MARALGSDTAAGLGSAEARARLASSGPNELTGGTSVRPWEIVRGQVRSPILLLLIAAGGLSAALGDVAESLAIFAIVVLNVWIGFRQEYRAERAMAALRAMTTPTVKVLRDGVVSESEARDLVVGDLAMLEAGTNVPVDGRLVQAHGLRVDESALTGESGPVDKGTAPVSPSTLLAERTSMAYSGTSVNAGRAVLLTTATGMDTELGHIAGLLQDADAGSTPLHRRLETLVRRLGLAAGAIVLLVFGLGLLRDEPFGTLLLTAVSLAVAAIPESLPAVVTVTLALGAQRMLARDALIRRLYAVETLGSVTTICSDKTGTLTQNRMTVTRLDVAGHRFELGDEPVTSSKVAGSPTAILLLLGGALCNDTVVADDGGLLGDPTETALFAVAQRCGLRMDRLSGAFPRTGEQPFDSVRKRMTTVHSLQLQAEDAPEILRGTGEALLAAPSTSLAFTKGAVDGLLAQCRHLSVDDVAVPLDDELRRHVLDAAERLAAEGIRVLGVGMRRWEDEDLASSGGSLERGLTFLGLEGMVDPARPEVREAVATCRRAGVRPVMVTGDHPLTAMAIGRDLGLVDGDARVLTGSELNGFDADELDAAVRDVSVFARVSPAHKIHIVEALQRQGQVVAMTGDGVNDAPALKQADIGVAMGITGTDVTKDAADMVLRDDNFATIVGAVREGRVVFDNIRKFIRYILSCNLAEVGVMVAGPLLGMPIPLLPLQILWLNLVTDGLPAMALAVERPEAGVMDRPPTPLRESLLGGDHGRRIVLRGAMLTVLTLPPAYLLWAADDAAWQTVLFTSLAFAELAGAFAMRSDRVSLWRLGPMANRAMVGAVAGTILLQVLLVAVPAARGLFGLEALDPSHWLLVIGIALAYGVAIELDKLLLRIRSSRGVTQRR